MFPQTVLFNKKPMNIVCRAAPVSAVKGIFFLIDLCQCGFNKCGGRPQKRDDPHPEYRSRSSGRNGRHHAYQISHAYPAGRRDNQGLQAGNSFFVCLFIALKGYSEHLREKPEREKPCPYCKIKSCRDKNNHQKGKPQGTAAGQGDRNNISPEYIVNRTKNCHIFLSSHFFVLHRFPAIRIRRFGILCSFF